ncbi:MAG: hypothetical protein ACR2JH_09600 [Solirubrobacteraceae bacterium]
MATEPSPSRCVSGAGTDPLGAVRSAYSGRSYALRRCRSCRHAFIDDPWTEFELICDDRYYAGQGADPLVDYQLELSQPERTVRCYEWRGIMPRVNSLPGELEGVRWLDFGSGNGGLVRYVNQHTPASACGYERGSIAAQARSAGIPVLDDLASTEPGSFDVVPRSRCSSTRLIRCRS